LINEVGLPINFDKNELNILNKQLYLSNDEPDDVYITGGDRFIEFTKHKDGFMLTIREVERDAGKIIKDKILKTHKKIKTLNDLIKLAKKVKTRYL